ncbi:hypothetical protein Tsubulata_003478 [Turnera subulata]|uniref:WD repeat-containing protein 6 n=1 Tax=Turnera subulata TaxID=218843 RepID=A0A9Q0G721_9ROSI|nr:hypothetical protein Tsubulata_003478 [Turnera subulata]
MAEQQQTTKWRLRSGDYLGEISALCFLHPPPHLSSLPFLLAGTGSQLLLYSLEAGKLIQSFQVFRGIRVHGITCCSFTASSKTEDRSLSFEIAVFGEKRVKLLILSLSLSSQNELPLSVELSLVHSLPRFSHWVLDVSFLKCGVSSNEKENHYLAVGCSDNSICIWNVSASSVVLEVQSPDKCLLYSMRLWGENLEDLRIASGTIFNEIIVWKVVLQGPVQSFPPSMSSLEGDIRSQPQFCQCKAAHICRLIGHEGSIFRIVWSSDGSKLVSVSDDRSARIWEVVAELPDNPVEVAAGTVLFGHNARVWDCCICDSLVVTAGEDCTCRVWGLDGKQLKMIREHIGRGVWRCLYDPNSSLLITGGFDSAIKVHQLPVSLSWVVGRKDELDQLFVGADIFTGRIPNTSEHVGLTVIRQQSHHTDSKSEYVRCLHFTREDTLYVATNHGYLYHAKFCDTQDAKWTKLVQVNEQVPIVCMDLLSLNVPKCSSGVDDWIALGDGKGNMTVVRVIGDISTPQVDFILTWSAGKERQLLGTYWCNALGFRFIFSADPRGTLRLWRLHDPLQTGSHPSAGSANVSLLAEFTSCFGIRIMCLDASLEHEVLVCGDLRGNLVLFPLSKSLLVDTSTASETKISPLIYFKGAHGISSVSSISVAKLSSSEIEIRSSGGDGCICYLEYGQDLHSLEFIGMKQVKELSLIESVSATRKPPNDLANCGYAVGFASTDFIIWNLITEAKVVQIPCGGWRRPHSYYHGHVPEAQNCFAYVKDEVIFVHRQWTAETERKIFPQNLHIQFHGREMHSLCFVSENTLVEANVKHDISDKSSWIATGCEDGTVRLTRYVPGVESWFVSKLLGEHVGGSAVRSICSVSKVHRMASDMNIDSKNEQNSIEDTENPFLLISVGAKRVLTSWLLRTRKQDEEKSILEQEEATNEKSCFPPLEKSASMSFKWLSTDMPPKRSSSSGKTKSSEKLGVTEEISSIKTYPESKSISLVKAEEDSTNGLDDKCEDDWRYLAVTAFLVRCSSSRLNVCFVAVACSDASVALRALVLPHRLWFDVAFLVPVSSPVLALQHVIIPNRLSSEENVQIGNAYIVIGGATDGSISFWDLTDSVENFVNQLSALNLESLGNCQKRPRTGRGSQGGRLWKSLGRSCSKKGSSIGTVTLEAEERTNSDLVNGDHGRSGTVSGVESCSTEMMNNGSCETEIINAAISCSETCSKAVHDSSLDTAVHGIGSLGGRCEIQPLYVFNNVHQSGVNCLHVSSVPSSQGSDTGFVFRVVSGGDDQALHCFEFELSPVSTSINPNIVSPDGGCIFGNSESVKNSFRCSQSQNKNLRLRFLHRDRVASAHSSAIKGIWTDGTWVFSTGLDQRIRCWLLTDHCKLTEQANLIISVPEPEALHARACSRNHYEIAVAGRGMQMVEFSAL